MAFSAELKRRLKEANFSDQQITALEIVMDRAGMSENVGDTDTGGFTGGDPAQDLQAQRERLQAMKDARDLAMQHHEIQREMSTHLQDQSNVIDRIADRSAQRLEYAEEQARIDQLELEIALNAQDLDETAILAAKEKVIESQKLVKSLKRAEKITEGLNKGVENFVSRMGLGDNKIGAMVDNLDVSHMSMQGMGAAAASFGLKIAASVTPMKIMASMATKAYEQFTLFDKAQFDIFQQTGIMDSANELAMMAEETKAFNNAGEEMKSTIIGLQQNFSNFQGVSADSRKELMLTTLALEGIGVPASESAESMAFFIQTLGQTPEIAEENTRKFAGLAEQLGRPPAEIIQNFNRMSGALAKHGPAMQGEFMKLQAVAVRTGLSVESLVGMTERFDTFESGAESVGMLNAVLGGPYLDTLTMISGTTTERLVELKGALDATGEDFQTMSQARRQAIAQEMGMGVDELSKFMSKSKQGIQEAMAEEKAAAQTREKMEAKRMKMMDLMQKITVALQEAMEEVFGTEMFDAKSLETVKSVFMSVLKVVKGIASFLGTINTGFSKLTGGKGVMSGLLTFGTVAAGTIAAKRFFTGGMKDKLLKGLVKKIPGAKKLGLDKLIGDEKQKGADEYLKGIQKVFIVGGDIDQVKKIGAAKGQGGDDGGDSGDIKDSALDGALEGAIEGFKSGGLKGALTGAGKGAAGGAAAAVGLGGVAEAAGLDGGDDDGGGGGALDTAVDLATSGGRVPGGSAAGGLAKSFLGLQGGATGLGGKIMAGLGAVAGPLMAAFAGIKEVMNQAGIEREKAMMGAQPDANKVGKMAASTGLHTIANILLQFIPGIGQAISVLDGVLSLFGFSPIKYLIDNLLDLVPKNAFFSGIGEMIIGGQYFQSNAPANPTFANDAIITIPSPASPAFANDATIKTSTRFNSSDTAEVVAAKEGGVLAKKLDKLIELLSSGQGNKEIVVKVDRKEIARAAISGINNDFYGSDVHSMG